MGSALKQWNLVGRCKILNKILLVNDMEVTYMAVVKDCDSTFLHLLELPISATR